MLHASTAKGPLTTISATTTTLSTIDIVNGLAQRQHAFTSRFSDPKSMGNTLSLIWEGGKTQLYTSLTTTTTMYLCDIHDIL